MLKDGSMERLYTYSVNRLCGKGVDREYEDTMEICADILELIYALRRARNYAADAKAEVMEAEADVESLRGKKSPFGFPT